MVQPREIGSMWYDHTIVEILQHDESDAEQPYCYLLDNGEHVWIDESSVMGRRDDDVAEGDAVFPFRLHFKTPDVMQELSPEQREAAEPWIKYGEYITIEFIEEGPRCVKPSS